MTNPQPCLTEHQEQCLLLSLCERYCTQYPDASLIYAIPNGYKKSGADQGRASREGLRAGLPDLCLPVARGGFHAFYVEMKRKSRAHVAPKQHEWHRKLEAQGNLVAIAFGGDDAWLMMRNYLDGKYRVGEVNQ